MTVNKEYDLIIFDWDGTLVNSVPNIVSALRCAGLENGQADLSDEAYKGVIGLSLDTAILTLYPELDNETVARCRESYRNNYFRLEASPSLPYPGVAEGLENLQQRGFKLAVATGKKRAGLQKSLDANELNHFFSDSRTADDAESKPHPMMLELILEELQIPAGKTLMVGDACFDLQMAANAGIDSVAVTYGAQSRETLSRYSPVLMVDTFDQLVDWLTVR